MHFALTNSQRQLHIDQHHGTNIHREERQSWCANSLGLYEIEGGMQGAVTTNDSPTGNARNATPHNHNASDVDVEVATFRKALRENANQNHGATTSGLETASVCRLSTEARVAMPGANTIKRVIQRQKAKHRSVEPQTIQGIILAHPWTTTGRPRPAPFLIHNCGVLAGPNRVIVFAADDAITHLANTDIFISTRFL